LLEKKLKSIDFNNTILITTLEPCTKRFLPKRACAGRIVNAGIKEVWIGINDPNPKITVRGYIYLVDHKVKVNYFPNEYADEVRGINKDFWTQETGKYSTNLMQSPDEEEKIINSSEGLDIEDKPR